MYCTVKRESLLLMSHLFNDSADEICKCQSVLWLFHSQAIDRSWVDFEESGKPDGLLSRTIRTASWQKILRLLQPPWPGLFCSIPRCFWLARRRSRHSSFLALCCETARAGLGGPMVDVDTPLRWFVRH